jgi:hypothetical protein
LPDTYKLAAGGGELGGGVEGGADGGAEGGVALSTTWNAFAAVLFWRFESGVALSTVATIWYVPPAGTFGTASVVTLLRLAFGANVPS